MSVNNSLQERLLQIKKRVAEQNDDNPAYKTETISMDFSTFIYKCIKQRLDPAEFFKLIKACYSILKWVLIEKKVIRSKLDIPFYTIIVNYVVSLKIRVSPYQNSETQVIFEGQDDEIDRSAIAQVCLNFFESYLEFYLESKKSLANMTYETYYYKMEKNKRDYVFIKEAIRSDQYSLTQEDIQLYMNDEEINDNIRASVKQRQQASISIKKYFMSIIKNFNLDIKKNEQSKEDIERELNEYRQRKKQQVEKKESAKKEQLSSQIFEVGIFLLIISIVVYLIYRYIIQGFIA